MLAVFEKRDAPKGAVVVVETPPTAGMEVPVVFPNKLDALWSGVLWAVAADANKVPRAPLDVVCGCEDLPRLPNGFLFSSAFEVPRLPKILLVCVGCEVPLRLPKRALFSSAFGAPRFPKILLV